MFFYPADFTFVCPTELGDLADNYAEFQKLGVEIYSVSTDTHFTHKAWHDTSDTIGKIKYPMIGDPTGAISRNFEVLREGQGLADRGTFLIDPDGVIQFMEVTAEGIGRNAAELLRKVKAAQYVAGAPGRGLPGQVGGGRGHPRALAGPRRQDLTARPSAAGGAALRPRPGAPGTPAATPPDRPRTRPETRHARRQPRPPS